MKIFKEEFDKLFEKLKSKKPFAFSKYADGEWAAMQGMYLNNNEFENNPSLSFFQQKLIESFQYKDENYFVGISCECCQGIEHYRMKEYSRQDDNHLTYANIFVNSNYQYYKDTFLQEYANHDVHLIANEKAKIENLPFKVEEFYPVGFSAWVNNYNLIEHIKNKNLSNKLFLFCCGPFGNLLAHQLHKENKNNIYLDIGSTLNPFLESEGFKRGYFTQGNTSIQTCTWD